MDVFHLFIFYFIFLDHHDFVDRGTTNVQFTYRHELHGSFCQFPVSHRSSALFHPSSPWREQSHEPLMIGFLFASAQLRLQLMNKSNEWHVIIEQGVKDGQKVGASGCKPEIICLENLRNEQEPLCFDFFLYMWLSGAIHVHRLEGK